MGDLVQNFDTAFASAAFISLIGSFTITWGIFKILDTIALKSKKLKAFLDGRIFKALQPIFPIIVGGIIGGMTFGIMGDDKIYLAIIKGLIAGKLSELAYHMVKRFFKETPVTDDTEK